MALSVTKPERQLLFDLIFATGELQLFSKELEALLKLTLSSCSELIFSTAFFQFFIDVCTFGEILKSDCQDTR